MSDLGDMPIEQRDELIAQVWSFLTERGYKIVAPTSTPAGCEVAGCGDVMCCAQCASVRPPRLDGGEA